MHCPFCNGDNAKIEQPNMPNSYFDLLEVNATNGTIDPSFGLAVQVVACPDCGNMWMHRINS